MMDTATPAPMQVSITRRQPVAGMPDWTVEQLVADESDRWGLYGDVIASKVTGTGHVLTVVQPRTHQQAEALRGAAGTCSLRGTHHVERRDP